MLRDERIDALLEQILESGLPPEEVCAEQPDLLSAVQAKLRRLKAVEAQIDSLFPSPEASSKVVQELSGDIGAAPPSIPDHEVQRILGRGGMGIVYQAKHVKLNRNVALKMLLTGSYASRKERLRFAREAEAVAALRHPNIVQIYEFGEVNGCPYFTMEYIGGGTLAEKLAGAALPVRESARLTSFLAQAVQVAHESGIVHRDLKPANILIADDGVPKISDFGLARRLDQESDLTNTGTRLGTPSYMAPEQMAGNSIALAPAVDIFALGAILYEMLTGHPPFRGESLSDTERKLATEEPPSPARLNRKVSHDLATICLKCLEKDPRRRYATAGDLAADLDRFLRHEPIRARPVGPAERSMRWIRRNPLYAALAVAFVMLLSLLTFQFLEEWAQHSAAQAERTRLISRFESGVQLVQEGRFAEAHAILDRLGDGGFEEVRQRIDRVLDDLRLVEKLEAIGVKRAIALAVPDAGWTPNAQAAKEYEACFADAGIGKMTDDSTQVALRVGASDIKDPLLAALDDWAVCEPDQTRRNWILTVAQNVSGEGSTWENQCRNPTTWTEPQTLAKLAAAAPTTGPSVQQLRGLGDRLAAAGLDATSFRKRVQQENVDNFLANLTLADALRASDPAEAMRYYQAALAIRPQSAAAHNNLAVALVKLGRSQEAIAQYERALHLDPNSAAISCNRGLALAQERPQEAIRCLQRALEINGKLAAAHRTLGEIFLQERRYADAASSLRACLPLALDDAERREILAIIQQCEEQMSREDRR